MLFATSGRSPGKNAWKYNEILDLLIEMMKEDQWRMNHKQSDIKEEIRKITEENEIFAQENVKLKN